MACNMVAQEPTRTELIRSNRFLDHISSSRTVSLLHVTTAFDAIVSNKVLMPSGGCLIGTIYCTPLQQFERGLLPHNLGAYIYEHEAVSSLRAKDSNKNIDALIIELDIPADIRQPAIGVNYLTMGETNLRAAGVLLPSLPHLEREHLQAQTVANIMQARSFLRMAYGSYSSGTQMPVQVFYAALGRAIVHLPILGYMYFEAVCEYIMLHSLDARSILYSEQGYINNWAYKDFIFTVQSSLLRNYNLGAFRPSIEDLRRACKSSSVVLPDFEGFIRTVQQQLITTIVECLLKTGGPRRLFIANTSPSFAEIITYAPLLVGHTLHREIRTTNRYRAFRYRFDEYKARAIWQAWNDADAILPYNAIVPKGEVGINPTHPRLNYKIFRGLPQRYRGELYFTKGQQLDATIRPQLLNPAKSFMGIT